jgi:hypothetical protein
MVPIDTAIFKWDEKDSVYRVDNFLHCILIGIREARQHRYVDPGFWTNNGMEDRSSIPKRITQYLLEQLIH